MFVEKICECRVVTMEVFVAAGRRIGDEGRLKQVGSESVDVESGPLALGDIRCTGGRLTVEDNG